MYDWANGGNIEDVVDDIEKIDFEFHEDNPNKLHDWVFLNLSELDGARITYSHRYRSLIMAESQIPFYEIPEMYHFGDDVEKLYQMLISVNIYPVTI